VTPASAGVERYFVKQCEIGTDRPKRTLRGWCCVTTTDMLPQTSASLGIECDRIWTERRRSL
jgi:hypothetical protein